VADPWVGRQGGPPPPPRKPLVHSNWIELVFIGTKSDIACELALDTTYCSNLFFLRYGTVAVMRPKFYKFFGVKCVTRPKLMTSVQPKPTTWVPVSHADPVGDPSFPVSPPWHHLWHCRLQLHHSLLPHGPQPHQRRYLRLQPHQLATTARPAASSWHPVHPRAYQQGMFGNGCRQTRRRALCTPNLSVSTRRTGAEPSTRIDTSAFTRMMSLPKPVK